MSYDAIAYIPLIFTTVTAFLIFILLAVIKIRNTAKVSFISFFSAGLLAGACIYAVLNPGIFMYALIIACGTLLLIPYCVMLAFGKPKEKTGTKTKTEALEQNLPQEIIKDVKPEEISIIDKGINFMQLSSDIFEKENGYKELLDSINNEIIKVTNADGGAILLVDDFDDVITVKSFSGVFPPPYKLPQDLPHKEARVNANFKYAQFPLRDNIFGEIASSGKSELITDPKNDSRINENGPEDFLKLGSNIFIPLRLTGKDIVIGLVALSRNPSSQPFTEDDFNRAQELCSFAQTALRTHISFMEYNEHRELTKESDIAASIQSSLIPKKVPVYPGLSLGYYTSGTADIISDSFDIISARSDRTSFVLMDVAGKGMKSLIVMIMIRAMFRLIVNSKQTAGTILSWANKGICTETTIDHFASVALLNYDYTKRHIQFATSGNIPVYRFKTSTKEVLKVSHQGDPLGVEKSTNYRDIEFTADKGDIIVMFTDGLVEALNASGAQYSVQRLIECIKQNNALSGKEIADKIKKDIKSFIENEKLHDDQSLLVIKIQ